VSTMSVMRSATAWSVPPTMIGDAHFEWLPDGSIKGSMHANSSMSGQSTVMDMTYAGERTGSCDYTASRHAH
jgi:hypothetical protein